MALMVSNFTFDWFEDSYLYVLWFMSFILSIYDICYYIVQPKVLYVFTLIISILYFYHYSFQFQLILSPFFLLIFFYLLDFFLPNSMGGGDVKLILMFSFFLSFYEILLILLVASFLGIIFILTYNFLAQKTIIKLPFVPFLTIALVSVTFFYH